MERLVVNVKTAYVFQVVNLLPASEFRRAQAHPCIVAAAMFSGDREGPFKISTLRNVCQMQVKTLRTLLFKAIIAVYCFLFVCREYVAYVILHIVMTIVIQDDLDPLMIS